MRIAYVVSRFPLVTETFVLREFDALDRTPEVDVELYSLFPAAEDVVHPAATRWVPTLHRSSRGKAVAALARQVRRQPLAVFRLFASVVRSHVRSPGFLGRMLVTTVLAAEHAETMHRDGVQHVHAHFATYPSQVAWVAHCLFGIPYSVTPHAHDIFVHQDGLDRRLGEAQFVVAISDFNRRFLRGLGLAGVPMPTVRCTVDADAYARDPRPIPSDGPVDLLFVSSLKTYKGHRVLFEALSEADVDDPTRRIRVDVVGDGPLRKDLEALVAASGLVDRVRFRGSVSEQEVREALRTAHILVQPSIVQPNGDTEGLPNTLIEAAAAEVPMLGTDVAGVSELVRDGETGTLVAPNDPAALRAGLNAMLADPNGAADRARTANAVVREEFTVERAVAVLTDHFAASIEAASARSEAAADLSSTGSTTAEPRVCQVIDRLVGGGQERVAAELAAALVGQVDRSALLATRGGGDYESMVTSAGAGLFIGERTSRWDMRSWFRMLSWLRRERFDVVHLHNPGALPAMAVFQKLPGLNFKIVLHVQMLRGSGDPFRETTKQWHRRFRSSVSAAVVTNTALRDYLIGEAGYAPDCVHVVPNPVDFDAWAVAAGREVSNPVWPQDGRATVIMVAQWRAQKDHPAAIEAAREVKDRGLNPRWVFVGTDDLALTGPAREQIRTLGLEDDVIIAGRRSDVPALLRHANVGLLATHFEGLPVALIEYCAAGLPSVVSEVEGTRDQIAPANGIIGVPEGNVGAIADAVEELLRDEERAIELGARAHNLMVRLADRPVVTAEIQAIYAGLR